jgi:hypothetical protein
VTPDATDNRDGDVELNDELDAHSADTDEDDSAGHA